MTYDALPQIRIRKQPTPPLRWICRCGCGWLFFADTYGPALERVRIHLRHHDHLAKTAAVARARAERIKAQGTEKE